MLLTTFWDVVLGSFLIMFIIIPIILLWVFALADLFRRTAMSAISRVLWLLAIVLFPIFGPLIYLLVRPAPEDIEYR